MFFGDFYIKFVDFHRHACTPSFSQLEDAMEVDLNRREGVTNDKVGQLEGAGTCVWCSCAMWRGVASSCYQIDVILLPIGVNVTIKRAALANGLQAEGGQARLATPVFNRDFQYHHSKGSGDPTRLVFSTRSWPRVRCLTSALAPVPEDTLPRSGRTTSRRRAPWNLWPKSALTR